MDKQFTRGWLVLQANGRYGAITKEFTSMIKFIYLLIF